MKVSQILEEDSSKAIKDEMLPQFVKAAEAFWKKRGAKFGKRQTIKDFKDIKQGSFSAFASLPSKFTEDTEFITLKVTVSGGGGYSGRDIECALWVIPFKKDGSEGQPIRLTYVSINNKPDR